MTVSLTETKSIHREEGYVKLEAATEVTLPQTKDHKKTSEAEIGMKERILPRSFRGSEDPLFKDTKFVVNC